MPTPTFLRAAVFSRPIAASLRNGLVDYWPLQDASPLGLRGNSLTPTVNPPTSTDGPGGQLFRASHFNEANLEWFSIADSSVVSMGAGVRCSICAWYLLDSLLEVRDIAAKRAGAGALEYYWRYESALDRMNFEVSPNGSTPVTSVSSAAAPSIATWYFGVVWYDGAALHMQINNGAVQSTPYTGDIFNGAEALRIGASNADAGGNGGWNGKLAGVGLWKRALSNAERAYLYNNGSPRVVR